ncbi:MAG: FKBP-type peptidyl-prolyl cis-trans isomerase [Candidatus Woesearchaeota archaeon]
MAAKRNKGLLFWVIFVLVVAAGLWYYYRMPKEAAPAPSQAAQEPGIEKGDLVAINYVLSMTDGTVIDTNNPEIAEKYNLSAFVKGPFRFIVGQSGKVKGFDEAITGAKLGQNFTRIITPSEPVLKYSVNRVRQVSRNQPIPRYQPFTFSAFEKYFGTKPALNKIVSNPKFPWSYKVVNITENHAVCDPVVKEGKSYHLPSLEWNSTLLAVSYNSLTFRHNPPAGMVITTELGKATVVPGEGVLNITYHAVIGDIVKQAVPLGQGEQMVLPQSFQVIEANDANFTIARINYPAQETLVLKAEILEWEKDVKEVKGEPIGEAKISVK